MLDDRELWHYPVKKNETWQIKEHQNLVLGSDSLVSMLFNLERTPWHGPGLCLLSPSQARARAVCMLSPPRSAPSTHSAPSPTMARERAQLQGDKARRAMWPVLFSNLGLRTPNESLGSCLYEGIGSQDQGNLGHLESEMFASNAQLSLQHLGFEVVF